MKLRSCWMVLVAALPLVSLQTSCSQDSPQEISATGTLQLRLTGQSSSGHTYRLRYADLEITGTSRVMIYTEDDPDAELVRTDLPPGPYEMLLQDDWFLEKRAEDGTFVRVKAMLTSPNPTPFEIVAHQTTMIKLRFKTDGEIVDLGEGTLEVSIVVEEGEECAPGQWQQIATLPTTPTRPIFVEGIQRIDADPDTLLVATQNQGSTCGGGTPAAIWRIDLDHDTGQATDVSFQQSLDLIQSTRRTLLESSDGTLFTGGGWCGATPPYYSGDHGDSFEPAIKGEYPPNSTFVYSEFRNQVYAGTGYNPYPGSVYRYNGGGSWSHLFDFPPPHNIVQAMAVHQGRLFFGATIYEDSTPCESTSPVYVTSDGASFTRTPWSPCSSVNALASTSDGLFALGDAGNGRAVFKWASATESWSQVAEYPFDDASAFQNLFVASGGALYAGAVLKGASNGGLYRSEDGVSWVPVVELEGLRLDTLNVEGETLYAAATPASGGAKIYALDLCE